MIRLKIWQWIILVIPVATLTLFFLITTGVQLNSWGLNWIWGVFVLIFVVWRVLLGKWTKPIFEGLEEQTNIIDYVPTKDKEDEKIRQIEEILSKIRTESREDAPIWEDWATFWQRCQDLVTRIAQVYHPEVKYPLLNIYVPQAYGLIRGTVDDLDRWMQQISPTLNQITVAQAYEGYELYRKLEPSARKLLQAWGWVQWVLNPVVAATKLASKEANQQANQQLLVNLSQLLREEALRNLAIQTAKLYSGDTLPRDKFKPSSPSLPQAKTQTLQEIIAKSQPVAKIEQKPLKILIVGRTGAGKSSLINTLFKDNLAEVDVLPSTDQIKCYHWRIDTYSPRIGGQGANSPRIGGQGANSPRIGGQGANSTSIGGRGANSPRIGGVEAGESVTLWDTPGYEQVNRADFRKQVLDYAQSADILLMVTPALDPSLQMDLDFLAELKQQVDEFKCIVVITQVDRLRPVREWYPPYNWQFGDSPKEVSIREAVKYRQEVFGDFCSQVVPIVTTSPPTPNSGGVTPPTPNSGGVTPPDPLRKGGDGGVTPNSGGGLREGWNDQALGSAILEMIPPAKQLRVARCMRSVKIRSLAAAKIIDRYTFQMATTQGLTAFLKSPILQFLSTLTTGSPRLALLLAEKIPIEQLPVVIGKLQLAYDLFSLFSDDGEQKLQFDLLSLWTLVVESSALPEQEAWAFGHALIEYWTQNLSFDQLQQRYLHYLRVNRVDS
jgi:predicted GTPase